MDGNVKTIEKAVTVAIVLVWSASLAFGSDVTQTTVRNGYIVNPDNVTVSIDGNTTSVLIGQNVQFMLGGNKTGTVTMTGVAGTPAEGHVVISDSTGWLDTDIIMIEEGLYNATYENQWELLAVDSPYMSLWFKVGETGVSSIAQGTPLGIGFTSNLDANDCIDLKIVTPEGYVLTQNPADPDQKFNDITVSKLLEYGSENESKRVNTSGWDIGTYTFWVRPEEENARGLDVPTCAITLAVCKADTTIDAGKNSIVELEKVKLIVAGVPDHNITISSSDTAHTIFPAGYEDNPPYNTPGFNDTIDDDGQRIYAVYFNDTGKYTIAVTDTTAGLDDSVDLSVFEKQVTFDVPSTVVIGTKFTIKGTVNTGNTVDIAVEDYVYPELNDLIIDESGEFEEEIDTATTNITSFTVPGPVILKAYIDRATGAGEIEENETEDGSVAILMMSGYLTAELSTSYVARGDDFTVNGTAITIGSKEVDIVIIAPNGSNGSMIDPSGTSLQAGTNIYHAIASVSTIYYTFEKRIDVGPGVDTGSYLVVVLSKGMDGIYRCGYDNLTAALATFDLTGKTQEQVLAILEDATASAAGSDDLMWTGYITVDLPFVSLNPIADVAVGEPLVVTGTSNREEGHPIVVTVKGAIELIPQMVEVEKGTFSAIFDTSTAPVGMYTVKADDGDGHTDEITVNIGYFAPIENIFDTNASVNPYPSLSGTHNGTIAPSCNITVSKLYTYPCKGTGGHTEYAKIYNDSWSIETMPWTGYPGNWYNLTFDSTFTLYENETYNYTIRTGSYPQIHHTDRLETVTGVITCTEFSDANRKSYKAGIPAIRLFL